jgi:hypothetical protein
MMRVVAQQGAWASSTKGRNRRRRTSWPLPLVEVAAGTVLYRLTRLHCPDPASFGRAALFRFDAPDHSGGVCYLGTSLDCCLLEVVTPTYRPTAVPDLIIARAQRASIRPSRHV